MRDEDLIFEELAADLRAREPRPDPGRRARTIARAGAIFSDLAQELEGLARHRSMKTGRARDDLTRGVDWMTRKTRMILAGGTALGTGLAALLIAVNIDGSTPEGPAFVLDEAAVSTSGDRAVATDSVAPPQRRDGPVLMQVPELAERARQSTQDVVGIDDGASFTPAAPARKAGEPMQGRTVSSVQAPQQFMAQVENEILPPPDIVAPGDRFEGQAMNPVRRTAEEPVSTFSIDVDTASWSYLRRTIRGWQVPSPDSVRIEEMVNYFDYDYPAPAPDDLHPFSTSVSTFEAPWDAEKFLVRIGIQGEVPPQDARPPLDIVFLVDTSGSMRSPDKIALLKTSLSLAVSELGPDDRVGIVTYAGAAGVALELTEASDIDTIVGRITSLETGGSTAGAAGLRTAYEMIGDAKAKGRLGRVILGTDGDFNVGMSSTRAMKDFIAKRREQGAYLSVLGFGRGNYNDALMQALAQNGNGHAAYIDTYGEARKVMVEQLGSALYPIADDVKIQVEFNPDMVAEYRLIGYGTRSLAREDFNNDKVDAGEIGAGHQVTALYEITPVGSAAVEIPPLRYGDESVGAMPDLHEELGYVNLRYKDPGASESTLIGTPILPAVPGAADSDARFAAAIAGFGQLLKDDRYLGDWGYADAADLARKAVGEDPFGYRAEAVRLIDSMQAIDG